MTHSIQHPVLLIEDAQDDIVLIKRAMRKSEVQAEIHVAHDGDEAIDYLSGKSDLADREKHPLPELVLLDLKLPRRSGFEILEWIRQVPSVRHVPVVVLTSSKDIQDIERAYDLGANSYLVKPAIPQDMQNICRMLGLYWLGMNVRAQISSSHSDK